MTADSRTKALARRLQTATADLDRLPADSGSLVAPGLTYQQARQAVEAWDGYTDAASRVAVVELAAAASRHLASAGVDPSAVTVLPEHVTHGVDGCSVATARDDDWDLLIHAPDGVLGFSWRRRSTWSPGWMADFVPDGQPATGERYHRDPQVRQAVHAAVGALAVSFAADPGRGPHELPAEVEATLGTVVAE